MAVDQDPAAPGPPDRPPEMRPEHGIGIDRLLAVDEQLLRRGGPAFRVAVLAERAVVLGVSEPDRASAAERARERGLRVVRRSSGGSGTLLGPGDIAWTIVLPRRHPAVGRDFAHAYGRLGAGVVDWLEELGPGAQWSEPLGRSATYCPLGPRGRVLTSGGRVLGGAAQHATSTALLHHGVVSYAPDRELLARLFDLEEEARERHLTGLAELGVVGPPERLADRLLPHLLRSIGTAEGDRPV